MVTEKEYFDAQLIVRTYEFTLGIFDLDGGIPFTEYSKFQIWMEEEGWYEAAEMEYDNSNDPNSCIRLNIKELYLAYKKSTANEQNGPGVNCI